VAGLWTRARLALSPGPRPWSQAGTDPSPARQRGPWRPVILPMSFRRLRPSDLRLSVLARRGARSPTGSASVLRLPVGRGGAERRQGPLVVQGVAGH
jgi:hypothetical protein